MTPKVIYLSACILTGHVFERPSDPEGLKKENLSQDDLKNMKAFRKIRDYGYAYLVLADRLLAEYRS